MLGDDNISSALVAQQRRQYVIGLLLLLIVVLEWTGSNFLTQNLFDDGYNKPFFVTYMNTASFSLYLLPAFVKHVIEKRNSDETRREQGYQALVDTDDEAHMNQEQCATSNDTQRIHMDGSHIGQSPLSTRETAKLAAAFCVLWFLANWSVNASLGFTSVASTTILSSMSGFFTLLIGRMFRVESLDLGKIAAVTISFIGSLLVSLADQGNDGAGQLPKAPGDFLALGSALFYALYVVLLKVQIGDESRINMQLFFGFVGIFNILGFWPIGAILHVTGLEVFELPNSKKALYAVLLNMFITLSSDFIYVLAMLKTTPLVVTVGLSLTIPLAVGGDLFLGSPTSVQSLIGATLVLIAFIVIGLEDRDGGTQTSIEGPPGRGDDRGRSVERSNGLSQVPLLNQAEDDENLRKSVEAIFAARREQDRRARRESNTRGSHSSNDQATRADGRPNPLDRGRSRTRSGTFRRERVSGSLRRSEERRTRSRTGRKSSSEQDDASRRDVRAQGWDYDHPILSDSEENAEV